MNNLYCCTCTAAVSSSKTKTARSTDQSLLHAYRYIFKGYLPSHCQFVISSPTGQTQLLAKQGLRSVMARPQKLGKCLSHRTSSSHNPHQCLLVRAAGNKRPTAQHTWRRFFREVRVRRYSVLECRRIDINRRIRSNAYSIINTPNIILVQVQYCTLSCHTAVLLLYFCLSASIGRTAVSLYDLMTLLFYDTWYMYDRWHTADRLL